MMYICMMMMMDFINKYNLGLEILLEEVDIYYWFGVKFYGFFLIVESV